MTAATTAAEIRSAVKLGTLYDAGAPRLPRGFYYRIWVDSNDTIPLVKVNVMRERRWWFDERIYRNLTPRSWVIRHRSPQAFIASCCAEAWRVAQLKLTHRDEILAMRRWNGDW